MLRGGRLRKSLIVALIAVLSTCGGAFALLAEGGSAQPLLLGPLRAADAQPEVALAARCRVTAVSLHLAPNPARATQADRIFGRVVARPGGGPCLPTVVLWRRLPGQRRFSVVATAATQPGGHYRLALPA